MSNDMVQGSANRSALCLSTKSHWNTATHIYVHIVDDCLHDVTVEMSSCNGDGIACKAKNIIWFFTEKVCQFLI